MARFKLGVGGLVAMIYCLGSGCSSNEPVAPTQPLRNPNTSVATPKRETQPTAKSPIPTATKVRFEEEEPEEKQKQKLPVEVVQKTIEEEKEAAPEKDPPIPESFKPLLPKEKPQILFLDTVEKKRRVHLVAEICLREGQLEALLCKAVTKEHEALLRIDLDGRLIHQALVAAGATPGTPAKFWDPVADKPDYKPATGTKIKLSLTYYKDGKLRTDPAQYWIRDSQANTELAVDWVFAGSRLVTPPDDPQAQPFYTANNGDLISIANFPDSMLDLPVKSAKENADRSYEAFTSRIPPRGTKVIITLTPTPES